jgi:transcriptional regulator with XRE-family HTH domain
MTDLELKERIAARLKDAREESGKSRAEVAGILGLSESSVGNWERAYRLPDRETIDQIAAIYVKSPAWLFCMEDDHIVEGASLPKELKDLGVEHITLAKSAKDADLSQEQIDKLVELIQTFKK